MVFLNGSYCPTGGVVKCGMSQATAAGIGYVYLVFRFSSSSSRHAASSFSSHDGTGQAGGV